MSWGTRVIHKQHTVCFRCRIALKDITLCPHCRQPMARVWSGFKAPPRRKVQEWKRLYERYEPYIRAYAEHFKVRLTHSPEFEREISGQGGYRLLLFSRKIMPHKKTSKRNS
jgi:hypothetical protein